MEKYMKLSPEGTRDYLFEECRALSAAERRIGDYLERNCYHQVKTPTMEFYDLFAAPCVGFEPQELYKLVDGSGRILALRADSTAPIARLTATKLSGRPLPLRLYYNQPVFGVTPQNSARADEVMQAGVELIGAPGSAADLEILSLASRVMRLFSPDFRLEIGHIGFFTAITADMSMTPAQREALRGSIATKNFPALQELLEQFKDSDRYEILRALPKLFGGKETLRRARALYSSLGSDEILDYLDKTCDALQALCPGSDITIDLGQIHRNDYYTGVIFRCYLADTGQAVLSGGRYDSLLSNFGAPMPAIGFGVNVDLLTRFTQRDGETDAAAGLLLIAEETYAVQALRERERLVTQGARVDMLIGADISAAKSYATAHGIERIVQVGKTMEEIQVK